MRDGASENRRPNSPNKEPVSERRVRTRFPYPAVIEIMCADEDAATDLWYAIYPVIKAWERGGS